MKRIFLALSCCLFLTSCFQQNSTSSEKKDAYDRVFSSGELKVGYIAYPPSFIIDPNTGKFSGISNDILTQAANKLGLKIKYTSEVSWGDMIEALRTKKVDVIATAVWPTASRGKLSDFSTPIFYSTVKAYVRVNDNRFSNDQLRKANVSNIKIAAMDGEMSLIIAQSDFPNAEVVSLPQGSSVSELALLVASSKADITFLEPAIAEAYIEKNPNSLKAVDGVLPIRKFPNVYMMSKGEYRLKSTLDSAIGELHNSNYINNIINQYEKYPGSFERIQ